MKIVVQINCPRLLLFDFVTVTEFVAGGFLRNAQIHFKTTIAESPSQKAKFPPKLKA